MDDTLNNYMGMSKNGGSEIYKSKYLSYYRTMISYEFFLKNEWI